MDEHTLPTAVAAKIDPLCQQFEAALRNGQHPIPEEYALRADSADREAVRRELARVRAEFDQETPPENSVAEVATPPDASRATSRAIATDPYPTAPSNQANPSGSAGPTAFDRYQVTGLLGQGGFGVVYRGFDPELRRQVAIKVPRRSREASNSQAEAYLNEARMVAALDHPRIVPVYDVGRTEDGLCFIVSKLIAGSDLAKLIADRRPDARRAAELVAQIAEALHHAHQRGLVHRDIKPGNILIDESGGPLVADFGLALSDESFGKGAGWCGTPAYMSPEQAAGGSHKLNEFAYPLSKKKITVDPADPHGTHLLLIVASAKPIGHDQLSKSLAHVSKPPKAGLRCWAPDAEGSRGPGHEVGTIDSYMSEIAACLPDDCQPVAALFLPTGP